MRITNQLIRKAFKNADQNFEFCWQVLSDMKSHKNLSGDFADRFLQFQEKLAGTIFELQGIRDQILLEDKRLVKSRREYKKEWFLSRVRQLSGYKRGSDYVVSKAKDFGDAYAHYFYQRDLDLLQQHLNHQQIMNHTASIGERGELEFIKKIKQIEGAFTLFHGITNTLRYGDFSFIDLKTLRVTSIGELKTSQTGENQLEFNLTLFSKTRMPASQVVVPDPELKKNRRGRQALGIMDFLLDQPEPNRESHPIQNQSYTRQVAALISGSRIGVVNIKQVSEGLLFSSVKLKKTGFYHQLFLRGEHDPLSQATEQLQQAVLKLMKPGSPYNSVIVGQLLYNPENQDKAIAGTIPLFWQGIPVRLLKSIYFGQVHIVSLFNPAHLVEQVQSMGLQIESRYLPKPEIDLKKGTYVVQQFDFFINYISNHLLTEDFVLDALHSVQNSPHWGNKSRIRVIPQQHMPVQEPAKKQSNKKRKS